MSSMPDAMSVSMNASTYTPSPVLVSGDSSASSTGDVAQRASAAMRRARPGKSSIAASSTGPCCVLSTCRMMAMHCARKA